MAIASIWALALAIGRLEVRRDPKLDRPHLSGSGIQIATSALIATTTIAFTMLNSLTDRAASAWMGSRFLDVQVVIFLALLASPLACLTIGAGCWAVRGSRPRPGWVLVAILSWFGAAYTMVELNFFPTV